jgi:hypothetical protein
VSEECLGTEDQESWRWKACPPNPQAHPYGEAGLGQLALATPPEQAKGKMQCRGFDEARCAEVAAKCGLHRDGIPESSLYKNAVYTRKDANSFAGHLSERSRQSIN